MIPIRLFTPLSFVTFLQTQIYSAKNPTFNLCINNVCCLTLFLVGVLNGLPFLDRVLEGDLEGVDWIDLDARVGLRDRDLLATRDLDVFSNFCNVSTSPFQ